MTEGEREQPRPDEHEEDLGLDAAPQGASDEGRPDVEQEPAEESDPAAHQSERSDAGHA